MAGKNVEHFSADPETRKGYFRKDSDGNPSEKRYQTEWAKMTNAAKKGFGKSLYQIHHIIPETSIYNKTIYEIKNNKPKQTYILDCMWISKWNINEEDNLIGLPDIFTFLIYFDSKKRKEDNERRDADLKRFGHGPEINKRMRSFHSNYNAEKRRSYLAENANPEKYPVHLPVSWGHTQYNKDVAGELKQAIVDPLSEVKDFHKMSPKSVAAAFKMIADSRRGSLKTNAARATWATWKKRYDGEPDPVWRKPFLMAAAKPLPTLNPPKK